MATTSARPAARECTLPPGPPGGAATNMPASLLEPLRTLRSCSARYGDAFTLDLGPFGPFVFISDPDLIRTVFRRIPG